LSTVEALTLPSLARLLVGSTLALASVVVTVRAQESRLLPTTLEALRAREVECESRLQTTDIPRTGAR